MNRTTAILISAGILALVALILSLGKQPSPPPTVPGTKVGTGRVSLLASPSTTHVLHGGNGEVFLEINLRAPETKTSHRLPLNIGLVVDRSGSMAGQKLANAREAASRLVSRLRDGDRIAIVTYGSDVTVLVPSTEISEDTRSRILGAISTITDRGGTFLSGGLERGREEALKFNRQGMVNRVILISDGQANEGITTTPELSAMARRTLGMGVNLTTMGVGLDFNEEVMTAMAEHGGGHYYFIQNSSAMARFFAEELDTMTSVVAKTAKLELALEPGVELLELYGYAYERDGDRVTVMLPDLFGGQDRKIMCKLRVPAGREGKVSAARITFAYVDADNGRKVAQTDEAELVVTSDATLVEKNADKDVLAKAEQVQAAATMDEAMKAYARGDVTRSKALLRAQIAKTKDASVRLGNPALGNLAGEMDQQLEGTAAAPSSTAGRSLVKQSKFRAYKLSK